MKGNTDTIITRLLLSFKKNSSGFKKLRPNPKLYFLVNRGSGMGGLKEGGLGG